MYLAFSLLLSVGVWFSIFLPWLIWFLNLHWQELYSTFIVIPIFIILWLGFVSVSCFHWPCSGVPTWMHSGKLKMEVVEEGGASRQMHNHRCLVVCFFWFCFLLLLDDDNNSNDLIVVYIVVVLLLLLLVSCSSFYCWLSCLLCCFLWILWFLFFSLFLLFLLLFLWCQCSYRLLVVDVLPFDSPALVFVNYVFVKMPHKQINNEIQKQDGMQNKTSQE